MPRPKGTPKTGGRPKGVPNKKPKRATEEREVAKNALVNTARGLWSQERKGRQAQRLGDPRSNDKVATR